MNSYDKMNEPPPETFVSPFPIAAKAAMFAGIDALGRAISDRFKSDPSAPGINLSYLPNGQWYGSILRYTERLGQGKVVLLKCKRATLEEVITELEYAWRDYVSLHPVEASGTIDLDTGKAVN